MQYQMINYEQATLTAMHFICGCPIDLTVSYSVCFNSLHGSICLTVDDINLHLKVKFPSSHFKQKEIAGGFKKKSSIGLYKHGGTIDDALIWTSKPSKSLLEGVKLGCIKLFCGRKKIWIKYASNI